MTVVTEVRVPKLNNNDATYVLVEWVAKDGQAVRAGEPLVELETSKAVEELTAELDGVVRHLLAAGAECEPGQVIATLLADGGDGDGDGTEGGAHVEADPASGHGPPFPGGQDPFRSGGDVLSPSGGHDPFLPNGQSGLSGQSGHAVAASAAPVDRAPGRGEPVVTEPARRFMEESGISMEQVRVLGRKVIRRADLEALVPSAPGAEAGDAGNTGGTRGTGEAGNTGGTRGTGEPGNTGGIGEADLIEPSRAQRRTAEVVERSHREIPASFTAMRVDVTDALPFTRAESKRLRALIGLPELLVQATGRLLEDFPLFFATPLDGRRARRATTAEVGVTVDVGNGMYVPVVRDAGRRPLDEIARDLTRFRGIALNGSFREQDLRGGNIMLTLHTDASITMAVPIVFPGHICALSLTSPRPETVETRDGAFVTRRVISLGLSYDHRYVNGRDAAGFLGALRTALEKPVPPAG